MVKDRRYCKSYKCLTITCSRHRCQIPKLYSNSKPIDWTDFETGCELYKGLDRWETLRDDEEIEDDWE